MSSLSWWLASMALAVLLWFINLCMTVVFREVFKQQGGDAIAQRINKAVNLLRAELKPHQAPRHYPYAFYVGNAVTLLIVVAMAVQKIVFFSVGDPYTAMLHAVNLMLIPLFFPIVARRWRIIQNQIESFVSGMFLMLCVVLIGDAYTIIVAIIVENIVR